VGSSIFCVDFCASLLPQTIGLWRFNERMVWQAVTDLESASLDQLSTRLRELQVPTDLIERMQTVLAARFAEGPTSVNVQTSSAALTEARNFFVVETGAPSQARLELYLY
jgi:hypothetical protein